MKNNEFKEKFYRRLLRTTIDVVKLLTTLKFPYELNGITRQLINSVSSVSANFTEGNGAVLSMSL